MIRAFAAASETIHCPGCGRRIIRPHGCSTSCSCGRAIDKYEARRVAIVEIMLLPNPLTMMFSEGGHGR